MAARDYFYRGPIARRIGDYMQANGGLIAAEILHALREGGPTSRDGLSRLSSLQSRLLDTRPGDGRNTQHARGLRLEEDGP